MSKEKPTTKTCKYCKTEIPFDAKICPNCRKKQTGKGCLTIVIIFVALFIIGILAGGNGDDSPSTNKENNNTTQITNGAKTEAPTETVSNVFHPGDVLETKKIKLSYMSCGEYSDSNMFIKPGDGNKFVYFEFEFENISDSDTSVGSFSFHCYADSYEASQALITADNSMTSIATLSSGRKMYGIVVFEVPENAEQIEVEYETSFWTQDKAIFEYQ